MSVKAKKIREIHCEAHNHRSVRCPRHEDGHKYRGVNKCWGCGFAFYKGSRYSYGPGSRRPEI